MFGSYSVTSKSSQHIKLYYLMTVFIFGGGQVTGELLDELSSWDALRAALPVGTVSGAPKVTVLSYQYFSDLSKSALLLLFTVAGFASCISVCFRLSASI